MWRRKKTLIIKDQNLLKNKCEEATQEEAPLILKRLEEELNEANKFEITGIGLAAPQIGINKRVAIVRIGTFCFDLINCSIEIGYDLIESKEGCLSVPGKTCVVKRYNEIVVKNNTLGTPQQFVAFGVPAICIQHELDHWDGMLMLDKAIPQHINIGDNEKCYCGSGIKYKKCCKSKTDLNYRGIWI